MCNASDGAKSPDSYIGPDSVVAPILVWSMVLKAYSLNSLSIGFVGHNHRHHNQFI